MIKLSISIISYKLFVKNQSKLLHQKTFLSCTADSAALTFFQSLFRVQHQIQKIADGMNVSD